MQQKSTLVVVLLGVWSRGGHTPDDQKHFSEHAVVDLRTAQIVFTLRAPRVEKSGGRPSTRRRAWRPSRSRWPTHH